MRLCGFALSADIKVESVFLNTGWLGGSTRETSLMVSAMHNKDRTLEYIEGDLRGIMKFEDHTVDRHQFRIEQSPRARVLNGLKGERRYGNE